MSSLELLHPGLQRWLKEQNWSGLRPVQEAALRPLLNGESCVIEAPTAGGKTEAALFPALTRAAGNRKDSVQVLYIAPLRALLNNLEARANTYARSCGLHAFKWHGDVGQTEKVRQLKEPPHLLLTTPESVEAILLRKATWRKFFSGIEAIIIDEAHSFASGDRGGHLLSLLERLETGTEARPQRIALSATIGNPEAMCQWLMGNRKPALRISVPPGAAQHNDYLIHHFEDDSDLSGGEGIGSRGLRRLRRLVTELRGKRTITFVRSRSQAEDMAKAVGQVTNDQLKVRTHHSAVSKYFREDAESRIGRLGEDGINAIFSTSTLELGIDIGELDRIIQLGTLSSPSSFLQRVGRTGRREGAPRYFRGLTTDRDELQLLTATVSLGLEYRSEALKLEQRAFHLLAHQTLCIALQQHGVRPDEVWQTLSRAYVFGGIQRSEFNELISFMVRNDYLRDADGVLIVGAAAERRYLAANWRPLFAVFSSAPMYDVMEGRTQVGTLDTTFVAGLKVPFHFTLAGKRWKADKVDYDSKTIRARRDYDGNAPKWESFGGPAVPLETAQRAAELQYRHRELPPVLDATAEAVLLALMVPGDNGSVWSPGAITYMPLGTGRAILRTFAGDVLNGTLANLLAGTGLKVRRNYAELTLEQSTRDVGSMQDDVFSLLVRIAESSDDESELASALHAQQRAWKFSPFAEMLPERLVKAALVDQVTDLRRLRDFVKQAYEAGLITSAAAE